MKKKIEKVLNIWYKHFEDEQNQYSEFENSDIDYFVGCLLYNHFVFSKALDNMKTMDLSYDFIGACGDEYDEIMNIIKTIEFPSESDSLAFLQEFIAEAKAKYSKSELYLLDRLDYHVNAMAQRYTEGVEAKPVDFQNPLLR